jgi:hypothetical protein
MQPKLWNIEKDEKQKIETHKERCAVPTTDQISLENATLTHVKDNPDSTQVE